MTSRIPIRYSRPLWSAPIRRAVSPQPCPPPCSARHSSTAASKDSQTFTLPDGRVLGYSEFGAADGYPLLFFHGFPSSRLEAYGLDSLARKRHIRVVTPDRPGYGLSTLQPDRRMVDWPQDVRALANHLGLTRFSILGASGGGPYALACAYALPPQMLSAVGLFASAGAFGEHWGKVPRKTKLAYYLSRYWPSGFGAAAVGLVAMARWVLNSSAGARRFEDFLASQSAEKGNLDDPAYRETLSEERRQSMRILFEFLAQGPDGMVEDVLTMASRPWGFDLGDIKYSPVRIWHGEKDGNATLEWIRATAECIPGSEMTVFGSDTHWTLVEHLDRVLGELIPPGEMGKSSE